MKPSNRRWTDAEKDLLRSRWAWCDVDQLAAEMRRSAKALRQAAKKMQLRRAPEVVLSNQVRAGKLSRGRVADIWTEADIETLQEEYCECVVSELAKRLGRSVTAVLHKANKIGLLRKAEQKPPTRRHPSERRFNEIRAEVIFSVAAPGDAKDILRALHPLAAAWGGHGFGSPHGGAVEPAASVRQRTEFGIEHRGAA